MSVQVLSRLPGRIRLHCPGSAQQDPSWTQRLLARSGIHKVDSNPWTENVLVQFDVSQVSESDVLQALVTQAPPPPAPTRQREPEPTTPAGKKKRVSLWARGRKLITEKTATGQRVLVHVNGIDRDPVLARQVLQNLNERPGVNATVSPLTGRVFIEAAKGVVDVAELVGEIARIELPPMPNEDVPSHPLDNTPLYQSGIRTFGSLIGLSAIAVQKMLGVGLNLAAKEKAATFAGWLGLAQSFPSVRQGLRRALGRSGAAVIQFVPMAAGLILSDGVLGLTLTIVEAGSLMSEVIARRAAWRRYEERLGDAPSALPGAVLRLESGQRAPRCAKILEGGGVSAGRSGRPESIGPGDTVSAGARLRGGPFVLELLDDEGKVETHERQTAPHRTIFDRYLDSMNLISVGHSLLTWALTRSPARAFEALLLVNPRPALIANEMADIGADTRVLRAGVVKVGTRGSRYARKMDAVVLDGARTLTDGFELTGVVPLKDGGDPAAILQKAAAVALAAGSPWGSALPTHSTLSASTGSFDGQQAVAEIEGHKYVLHSHLTPEVLLRLGPQEGTCSLTLKGPHGNEGVLLLRPRLQPSTRELVEVCRKNGIRLEMLSHGDAAVTRAVAERAGIELLAEYAPLANDPSGAMRRVEELQMQGLRVAMVSDNHRAASAFHLADLAIGLSTGMGVRFPARADFLAPDIAAVVAILEAGVRHRKIQYDGVALSVAANIFGAAWGFRNQVGVRRASMGV